VNIFRALFRRAEPIELVLFSRPGCHLCEEMKVEIRRAKTRRATVLSEVNIESDPDLERQYGQSIPVLTINGRLAFKGRLTTAEFERKFARLTEGEN